jgi:hypothetical protein
MIGRGSTGPMRGWPEQLQAIWVRDPKSGSELRHLRLTLFLGSLHTLRGP